MIERAAQHGEQRAAGRRTVTAYVSPGQTSLTAPPPALGATANLVALFVVVLEVAGESRGGFCIGVSYGCGDRTAERRRGLTLRRRRAQPPPPPPPLVPQHSLNLYSKAAALHWPRRLLLRLRGQQPAAERHPARRRLAAACARCARASRAPVGDRRAVIRRCAESVPRVQPLRWFGCVHVSSSKPYQWGELANGVGGKRPTFKTQRVASSSTQARVPAALESIPCHAQHTSLRRMVVAGIRLCRPQSGIR